MFLRKTKKKVHHQRINKYCWLIMNDDKIQLLRIRQYCRHHIFLAKIRLCQCLTIRTICNAIASKDSFIFHPTFNSISKCILFYIYPSFTPYSDNEWFMAIINTVVESIYVSNIMFQKKWNMNRFTGPNINYH